MSDFAEIQRRLLLRKSRKATAQDLQTSAGLQNPLKYESYNGPARDIKLIPVYLVLPAFSYTFADIPELIPGLLFQYNFTAPFDFYILNKHITNAPQGFLTVKWRVGNTCYRYKLTPGLFTGNITGNGKIKHPFRDYENQKVKKNCVFEWWLNNLPGFSEPIGMIESFPLLTSELAVPDSPDQISVEIPVGAPVTRQDMVLPLPHTLPFDNTINAWLDNP